MRPTGSCKRSTTNRDSAHHRSLKTSAPLADRAVALGNVLQDLTSGQNDLTCALGCSCGSILFEINFDSAH